MQDCVWLDSYALLFVFGTDNKTSAIDEKSRFLFRLAKFNAMFEIQIISRWYLWFTSFGWIEDFSLILLYRWFRRQKANSLVRLQYGKGFQHHHWLIETMLRTGYYFSSEREFFIYHFHGD